MKKAKKKKTVRSSWKITEYHKKVPEDGWRVQRPKDSDCSNQDEYSSLQCAENNKNITSFQKYWLKVVEMKFYPGHRSLKAFLDGRGVVKMNHIQVD